MSIELLDKIAEDRNLVKELEGTYPLYDNTQGMYDPANLEWIKHNTKVNDCYWRIRMNTSKLEGASSEELNQIAAIG